MPALDVTIVIVNWNGGSLLLRCLESIRASRCSAKVDVIVVDNHSADGSREEAAAAFPEFRVIDSGSNLGFGRANNLARPLVRTPLVLFLNPDTQLLPGTLELALQCLDRRPGVGALGCRMLYPDGRVQELGLQWESTPWTVLLELLLITDWSRQYLRRWLPTVDPLCSGDASKLYGGFMLVRRQVLEAAGWFDERYFMYAEDADLCRTIRALGWTIYYCSEAALVHVTGGLTAAAPSMFSLLMKQESINKLIAKYQGRSGALLHRAAVLLGGLARLAVLLPVGCAAPFSRRGTPRSHWEGARLKHWLLVLWSLGLRKAAVPVAPCGRGECRTAQ